MITWYFNDILYLHFLIKISTIIILYLPFYFVIVEYSIIIRIKSNLKFVLFYWFQVYGRKSWIIEQRSYILIQKKKRVPTNTLSIDRQEERDQNGMRHARIFRVNRNSRSKYPFILVGIYSIWQYKNINNYTYDQSRLKGSDPRFVLILKSAWVIILCKFIRFSYVLNYVSLRFLLFFIGKIIILFV